MSIEKQAAYFGGEAERRYGYAQAIRVGETVYVSGQIARGEGGALIGPGDMAAQMRAAYEGVARALAPFGADLSNVVEEVLYVTDIAAASQAAGEVRHEAYGVAAGEAIEVASTLVQVAALAHPGLLVENPLHGPDLTRIAARPRPAGITPSASSARTSGPLKPKSASTSRVCSPSAGAGRRASVGVFDIVTIGPTTCWGPVTECSSSVIIPSASTCGSSASSSGKRTAEAGTPAAPNSSSHHSSGSPY